MATTPASAEPRTLTQLASDNRLPPRIPVDRDNWYRPESIAAVNWNKSFPYQLLVVEQIGENEYVVAKGGTWKFTLPIPPESLAISMPFAVNASVTLGGYVEEHNGAPIRMIQMTGTTGILFGRGEAKELRSFRETILAGTATGLELQNLTRNAREIFSGPHYPTNAVDEAEFGKPGGISQLTGYYQFRLLQLFFESYAEVKKTRDGRKYRLAFAIWKDEAVYLCAPMSFDLRRSADSPLEYMYSISLKGLKRITLAKGQAELRSTYVPVSRDPKRLATFLGVVERCRMLLQSGPRTIQAFGGDVGHILFEPLRELTLMAKDLLAIPLSLADLADSLIQDCRRFILDSRNLFDAVTNFPSNFVRRFKYVKAELSALTAEQSDSDDELPDEAVINNLFVQPKENYDFFSQIRVGDLRLPPAIMRKIADERTRVRQLTRLDYEQRRDAVAKLAADLANTLGVGHPTYNQIYGIEAPLKPAVEEPRDEDFEVLHALNQVVLELNRLAVSTENEPQARLDAIAHVAGMASRSGIAFRMPVSKFAVPFPYGSTLEMLANRYLGDPNRWHEIAALNGLQSPYVDEEGFSLPLLVNGAGNRVMVADATLLYVGQPVWIGSTAVRRTRRRITGIHHLTDSQHVVSVDGDSDLNQYTTLANATLYAFRPNTVNSQMLVWIPSEEEPQDSDFRTKSIPGVDEFDSLIAVGGVDLLLTPQNDLVITPEGDTKWAVGLTNIIQKVRLALSVRQGALLRHPEYGLPLEVGASIADLNARDMMRAVQDMFSGDPTFTGVKAAKVDAQGALARLGIAVEIAGTSQVIPISVETR